MRRKGEISKVIKLSKADEKKRQLSTAAKRLFEDYTNDLELIAFSSLDQDDFLLSVKSK
jgi:hypothetical protein